MIEDIKRWTAKRKSALVMEIIQGKTLGGSHTFTGCRGSMGIAMCSHWGAMGSPGVTGKMPM